VTTNKLGNTAQLPKKKKKKKKISKMLFCALNRFVVGGVESDS
jgi:hypothetical protein